MLPSDRFLNLLGHDLVRRDVADVVHIPVEANEVVKHTLSIYASRIYTQTALRP